MVGTQTRERFRLAANDVLQDGTGARGIGLDIQLKPDWQLYGENPGELGVSPEFDWSESRNIEAVFIKWPEPVRYFYSEDPPMSALGYKGSVFLPIQIMQGDPDQPSSVRLLFRYAICDEHRISDQMRLQIELPSCESAAGVCPRGLVAGDRGR
jgi:suppressor for copper-sensitivity B